MGSLHNNLGASFQILILTKRFSVTADDAFRLLLRNPPMAVGVGTPQLLEETTAGYG